MIIGLFAVDQANGMGFNDSLPWPRNPEDMRWFKSTTENQVVVMGRKTWNSRDMPVPLPKRHNVLVTNQFIDQDSITQIRGDIPTGLVSIQEDFPDKNIYVIGGPDILVQAEPVLEQVLLTRIPGEYLSDVRIDLDQFLSGFSLKSTLELETCKIETYEAISRRT